ncbi:UDP-N-acetylmuramate dehydrogenase [Acetobacteraceae bacterium]|nr:UDP-N-acetylmuramate dehydrogenase [Candidatus Parcubacteria bacterium]
MQIEENIPLAPLTTFGIGGEARFFARVHSTNELREVLAFGKEKNFPTFILGGGSNVLIDDAGFPGLVIKIELLGVEEKEDMFVAAAGESWDALVERTVKNGMWGIENLSGIPGTVGGAVVQNIGAYGSALSQTLEWLEVYDTHSGEEKRLTKEDYKSGYRDSIFKREPDRYVVLRVALKLSKTGTPDISYKDLALRFKDTPPSILDLRAAVLEIRAGKFPDLHIEGTAGSFFKNPVLPAEEAHKLQEKYPELPLFPLPESKDIKVPLGWFLDYRHGVIDMRSIKVGGARMYEKQFLVVVAERNSSSRDVKELARLVQEKVKNTCNLNIEPEVRIV